MALITVIIEDDRLEDFKKLLSELPFKAEIVSITVSSTDTKK